MPACFVTGALALALGFAAAAAPAPPPDGLDIQQPVLPGDKVTIDLEAPAEGACLGGGGRYLILHLPRARKLAVVDVNVAKVVHTIPAEDNVVRFAANRSKLVVYLGGANVIQRYDLTSGEREASVPWPLKGEVFGLAMGAAASDRGPLLVAAAGDGTPQHPGGTFFLDVRGKMTPVPMRLVGAKPSQRFNLGKETMVRAAANNQVFGMWNPHLSPQGFHTVRVNGTEMHEFYEHDTKGHITPGPEGRLVYTSEGVYTVEGKPLTSGTGRHGPYMLPAAHGDCYLSVTGEARLGAAPRGINVHFVNDERPVLTITDIALPKLNRFDRDAFNFDQRVILVPNAKVLISIPDGGSRVVLRRCDVEVALQHSATSFLVVTSVPPASVRRGAAFVYPLTVRSSKGGVTFRVEKGPAGLKVNEAGEVRWAVPQNLPSGERQVIVAVKDASGQEAFHRFALAVK